MCTLNCNPVGFCLLGSCFVCWNEIAPWLNLAKFRVPFFFLTGSPFCGKTAFPCLKSKGFLCEYQLEEATPSYFDIYYLIPQRKRMAVVFTNLSCWLWGGKEHETTNVFSATSLNSSFELNSGIRESDMVKFTSVKGDKMREAATIKVKRKWHSREERRIDKEYDLVLVPSDGGCGSGSESDDSDWSIGWMEPHAPDFQSFDESENSFAVLVPCYAHGNQELVDCSTNQRLGAIVDLTNNCSDESKEYLEHWLSSLQST